MSRKRLFAPLTLAVLLLAAGVRFHQLGEQSLWYDEGVAYAHARRSLPELIPLLQRNVHAPAYFALLGVWEDLAGASEFSLRALSAFFSILSVAWTYALGRRLFHPIAGLAAAALAAFNAFSVYYAQEARMYAMLAAVAGGSMWVYVGFLRQVSRRLRRRALIGGIIALGLLNGIGMYTHLAYALVMLTQGMMTLLWRPAAWRALLACIAAGLFSLVLFSPWLSPALSQVAAQPNLSAAVSLDQMLWILQGWLAFGSAFEFSMGSMGFAVYFLLLFGLIGQRGARGRWRMLLPVAWTLVSALVYLYLELTTRYIRFLLPAQLAFALWMGRGFWVLWTYQVGGGHAWLRRLPRWAALAAGAGFLLTLANGLDILYRHPDFQRDDVRGLARRIETSLRPGDAVLASAAGVTEALGYYYGAAAPLYGLPTSADDDQTRRQVLDILAEHDRVYAVFYGAEEQDPNRVVESTLNRHAYEIHEAWVGDMRFASYATARLDAPRSLDLRFGDRIVLRSYALGSAPARPGDALPVRFIWSADERPAVRYKVFLQLLDADGRLAAQRDSEPGGGLSLTTTWPANRPALDNHALPLPADLPAGDYTLIAGLYDINDPAARLPVNDASYVELAPIRVEPE